MKHNWKTKFTCMDYFAIPCIALAIVLDQITKFLATSLNETGPIKVIDGVFELQYLENRGAAFGILQNQQWFFLVIGILLTVLITILYLRLPKSKRFVPLKICLIFIVAGAIGNMIDRVLLNYVIDFLYFSLIDFPIFNVADIYVTCATITLAVLILFYYKEEEFDLVIGTFKKKEKKEEQE